jgi:hypothetical protein
MIAETLGWQRRTALTAIVALVGLAAIADPVAAQSSSSGQSLGELWANYHAFVALITIGFAFLGALSKSLTIGAWSGYLAFLYMALNGGASLFRDIALVTLVLTFLGMAFKLVRLEFSGEGK